MDQRPSTFRQATVLVIEDDDDLRDVITARLQMDGHRAIAAADGLTGLQLAASERPDVVLLDQMLPDLAGTEVARRLLAAEGGRDLPIVFVSARAEEIDRVVAFEMGAQDFVKKPFSMRELMLRVRAILRRRAEPPVRAHRAQAGPIRIDREGHQAWVDDDPVALSQREFEVLALLVDHAGRLLTREQLVVEIWPDDVDVLDRAVDSVVMRLRSRLGPASDLIKTVRGAGYRLNTG